MEQTGRQRAYVNTRVYSPTRGSSAYAYETAAAPQYAPQPQPTPRKQPAQDPQRRPLPQPKRRRKAQPTLSPGSRAALLFSVIVLSGALLFAVMRYYTIVKQHIVVNELQQSIETSGRNIRALNIELECAVSINDVQEAAERMGMTYPDASQYVRAGDALPNAALLFEPEQDENANPAGG